MRFMVKSRIDLLAFSACALLAVLAMVAVGWANSAEAAPSKCFGKKINKVIKGNNKTVKLGFKDVAWVAGNKVTVIGKPYSTICADAGIQIVRAGKGKSKTSTGAGNDRIFIGKSSKSIADGGLGDDTIIGSKGHDYIYASPKKNPKGVSDTDTVRGNGGNDYIYDYSGEGNQLYGLAGSDQIHSLGDSVSTVHGGDGSDFIYSTGGETDSGSVEKLFGERGNDTINGDRTPGNGPVLLDGGAGDDWLNGGRFDDTAIVHSGIVKIDMGGGDDLIVAASGGRVTMDGGGGRDAVSWAAHTPKGNRNYSGVDVNLKTGEVGGVGVQTVKNVEDVIGSSFDDTITGEPGVTNDLRGAMGDDELIGQYQDEDNADGGLGENDCSGFRYVFSCNEYSPGGGDQKKVQVEMDRSGVLTVFGSRYADRIDLEWKSGRYLIDIGTDVLASGLCDTTQNPGEVACTAPYNNLNGMLIYGNDGPDDITVGGSVPAFVTTTINGGTGANKLIGGATKDVITTEGGASGTVMRGGDNLDQLWVPAGGTAFGEGASDVLHAQEPCEGGRVSGGPGNDNLVFSGAPRGVKADLGKGEAGHVSGSCNEKLKIDGDVESLEGTKYNDVLILGKKKKGQSSKRSLLGREGFDTLNSKNGYKDKVTTGSGGKKNKVISDKKDKVTWGWGGARF